MLMFVINWTLIPSLWSLVYQLLFLVFKTFNVKRNSDTHYFLQNIVKSNNSEATRKSSQNCINYFYTQIPNLLGGSADLTGSNLTKVQSSVVGGKNSNYIHYGVREHLMAAAMNGISVLCLRK